MVGVEGSAGAALPCLVKFPHPAAQARLSSVAKTLNTNPLYLPLGFPSWSGWKLRPDREDASARVFGNRPLARPLRGHPECRLRPLEGLGGCRGKSRRGQCFPLPYSASEAHPLLGPEDQPPARTAPRATREPLWIPARPLARPQGGAIAA